MVLLWQPSVNIYNYITYLHINQYNRNKHWFIEKLDTRSFF